VFVDENVLPAANGDLAAFERIYQTYYRVVYSRCLRMTRSVAEAEDLTQDVFIQCFVSLRRSRANHPFPIWLHRLLVCSANALPQAETANTNKPLWTLQHLINL
jgi:DNA-directed RNA polymerase specialized sigma24 family protein